MAPRAQSRGDGIFLSYRRGDSPGPAGRRCDILVRSRPHDKVCMDHPRALEGRADDRREVSAVVIGPGWLSADGDTGRGYWSVPGARVIPLPVVIIAAMTR